MLGLGRWLEVWWAPPHLWRAVQNLLKYLPPTAYFHWYSLLPPFSGLPHLCCKLKYLDRMSFAIHVGCIFLKWLLPLVSINCVIYNYNKHLFKRTNRSCTAHQSQLFLLCQFFNNPGWECNGSSCCACEPLEEARRPQSWPAVFTFLSRGQGWLEQVPFFQSWSTHPAVVASV